MEQTHTYQLNQWAAEDRILREDFNADNAKLEAALLEAAEARNALSGAISKCGNCRIATQTYTGTGTYGSDHKTSLTFDAPPLLVIVADLFNARQMFLFPGSGSSEAADSYYVDVFWEGNSVSWCSAASANYQYNYTGRSYYALALFATA